MNPTGPLEPQPAEETGSPAPHAPPRTAGDWLRRHADRGHHESVGYIGLGEAYNRWLYRLRRRHFRSLASRHNLAEANRILDVGAGNGFYVGLYRQLGLKHVCGIDISPTATERLSTAYPGYRFAACDITVGLPASIQPESGFDWVSAMDVLFHITEDALFNRALANCAGAVRPGGCLLVSDNFPSRTLPADDNQAYHALGDYEDVLQPRGFRLVELSPVFFISNGQVGDGGAAFSILSSCWRVFARGLGKTVRSYRPLGEAMGNITGAVLTGVDALLQRRHVLHGFSTKTALFQKAPG